MNGFGVNFTRGFNLVKFNVKKYSPEILTVAGAAGCIGGTIWACKATLKLPETIEQCKERKALVEAAREVLKPNEYKKEITKVNVKNAIEIGKLYAPAAVVEGLSIGMIFGANMTLRKTNAGLAAAYGTLDKMYKKYRKNVIDTFGEEVDKDMRFGIKHEKIEEIETDENGKEKKVKKEVAVVDYDPDDPNYISEYGRFFDSTVFGWDKNPEINMMTLKSYQSYANNLLKVKGYLFLNDVYKIIGFEPSIAGQSVGWVYDPNNEVGDNYIDFGIFEARNANRRFVNGYEPVILLDFNVDGDIIHDKRLNIFLKGKLEAK